MKRAVLAWLLVARAAGAQPAPQVEPNVEPNAGSNVAKAAALYESGKRRFDLAEFAAAIAAWREAYRLSAEPLLVFNIAQAYRLSGDCAQANRFYLTYTRLQPKPDNKAELDAAMRKCAGVEPASGDSLEPRPVAVTVPVAMPETSRDAHESPANLPRRLRLASYASGGVAVISAGLALGYALTARSKASTISDQPASTEWDSGLIQIDREGRSAQTRARLFTVAAIVAGAASGVLWWQAGRGARIRVETTLGPRDAGASVRCAF